MLIWDSNSAQQIKASSFQRQSSQVVQNFKYSSFLKGLLTLATVFAQNAPTMAAMLRFLASEEI